MVLVSAFPKNPHTRALWNRQIKTTRPDWHSPSEYSCVCGKHFTEDSFQPLSLVSGIYIIIIYSYIYIYNMYIDKLGLKRKKLLLPEAVPTIFPSKSLLQSRTDRPRKSKAFEKRECSRVSL